MYLSNNFYRKNKFLPVVGLSLGLFFWVMDAIVDYLFFNDEHDSFQRVFFNPESMDIWMRLLVIGILLAFSFLARKILNNEMRARLELENYKNTLEQKVEERTLELQARNEALHKEISLRRKVEEDLKQLAITDPLTGLINRRMFHQLLITELERVKRSKSGLGIIFCDLDHFKLINDQFGHNVGDTVLNVFADNIKKLLRESDVIARWGGEEFIILIPQATLDSTLSIANKLQLATEKIHCPPIGSFTCSFGVTICYNDDTVESFVKRADDALYLAKNKGRNRVEQLVKES